MTAQFLHLHRIAHRLLDILESASELIEYSNAFDRVLHGPHLVGVDADRARDALRVQFGADRSNACRVVIEGDGADLGLDGGAATRNGLANEFARRVDIGDRDDRVHGDARSQWCGPGAEGLLQRGAQPAAGVSIGVLHEWRELAPATRTAEDDALANAHSAELPLQREREESCLREQVLGGHGRFGNFEKSGRRFCL